MTWSEPVWACLLLFWTTHFPSFTLSCWPMFSGSCFYTGCAEAEVCFSVLLKTLSIHAFHSFKLFLMTPCHQLLMWVFQHEFLSFVSIIRSACDPFFYHFCLSWLSVTSSSPESSQISSISTQAYQREIPQLCQRILPACLCFFLVHFTPSFWCVSSVWTCF